MRRTVEEVQFLGINTEVNPFKVFEPEHEISMDRAGKILNISEDGEIIGICLGLPTVATIRGFSASRFTDIIFDEFIPEKHVIQRKTEGDALLNAYTTINGNRELEGRPPVRLWLLANSNNINSPILTALGLVDPILRMREKGQEVFQKDGVLIAQSSELDDWMNPDYNPVGGRPNLMTSPVDFATVMQMLANGGTYKGKKFLGAGTVEMLHANQLGPVQMKDFENDYLKGYGYGYGFRTLLTQEFGHNGHLGCFGWTGGSGIWVEADPVAKLSIAYMHNMSPNEELYHHHRVRSVAYGCLL